MSKLVVLKNTAYISHHLKSALDKMYDNCIEIETDDLSLKQIQSLVEENTANGSVIIAKNGENSIRYRGYYGGETQMVNILVITSRGQKIGFIKNGAEYTAVLDDMYMSNEDWQTLGKLYAEETVQNIAAMYGLQIASKKTIKKTTGYKETELEFNVVGY